MRFSIRVIISFAMVFAGNIASATTYECDVQNKGVSYLPEILIIQHDEIKNIVIVYDPVIAYFNDETPLAGSVGVNNSKRITFKWTLKGISTGSNQYVSNFNYTATYIKRNGNVTVSAIPLGYDDVFRGFGKCRKTS